MNVDTESIDAREYRIPLGLLGAGLGVFIGYGLFTAGPIGMWSVLGIIALNLIIGVVLALVGCYIAAFLLSIDFGYLHTAALKLAGILCFSWALSVAIPLVGVLVALVVYWALLERLFELEPVELITCVVILFLVRVVGGVLGGGVVVWLMG